MVRENASFHPALTTSFNTATSERDVKTVRVGLAGCGVVGSALVRMLHSSADSIQSRHGVRFELSRVLVRDALRDRGLPIPQSLFTADHDAFIAEDNDVVIEAIGGCESASRIARAALTDGKGFVTSNKDLIASEGAALATLAERRSVTLDFGACVGGSAPVIALLRDLVGSATPRSIRGIFNGTSNYVISLMERGSSLSAALQSAQAKGLAESDSSRDLDGRDIAAKLAIVAWISYGIAPSPLAIPRLGIGANGKRLVDAAASIGGRLRLIGECCLVGKGQVSAFVEPVVFSRDHSFARTELEDNRVEADLGWSAPLTVSGPGAGGEPTALALLGDLLNAASPRNGSTQPRVPFDCVEDPREHRWLIVSPDGHFIIGGTRRAILEAFLFSSDTAIARVEIEPTALEVS